MVVARADGGEECEPVSYRDCVGTDVYWFDSCGEAGEVAEECAEPKSCSSDVGRCCLAQATGPAPMPAETLRIDWRYLSGGQELVYPLTIDPLPTDAPGQWIEVLGTVDGTQFAISLYDDPLPGVSGRGIMLSRLGVTDTGLAKQQEGQFVLSGKRDGTDFVAIGREFDWSGRELSLVFWRLPLLPEPTRDLWIVIVRTATGETIQIGAIYFPRLTEGIAGEIDPRFATRHEFRQAAADYAAIPEISFRGMPELDNAPPTTAYSSYGDFMNSDVEVRGDESGFDAAAGGSTARCTDAGSLL